MKKKMLSLLLCLLLFVGLLPSSVFAAGTDYQFSVTVGGKTVSVTSENCSDVFGDGKVAFTYSSGTYTTYTFSLDSVHIDEIAYRRSNAAVTFDISGIVMIDKLTKIETSTVIGTGALLLSDKCTLADLIHYDRPDGDSFSSSSVLYARGRTTVYAERKVSGPIWTVAPLASTSRVFIYCLNTDIIHVSRDIDQLAGNGISLYGRDPRDNAFADCYLSHYNMAYWGEDAAEVVRRDTHEVPTIEAYASERPAVEYPLWIAGVQVTSENKDDVLGNKKVSYIPAASENAMATLVLNSATIANGADKDLNEYELISEYLSYAGIIAEQNLEIVVNGSCSIRNAAATPTRIPEYPFGESYGSAFYDECVSRGIDMRGHRLIISGDGSLTVSGGEYAIVDADPVYFFSSGKTVLNGKEIFKGNSFKLGVYDGRLVMKKTGTGAIFEGRDALNLDMNEDFILYGGENEFTTELLKYDLCNGLYYIMTKDGNSNINYACIGDRIVDSRSTIANGALALSGASVNSDGNIASENTLADIVFSYPGAGFTALPATWYENGLHMAVAYGDSVWRTKTFKPNAKYTAYITLRADDGYRFSDSTSITLNGATLEIVSIDNNYSEFVCKTPAYYTTCTHTFSKWSSDASYHWHECTACGKAVDKCAHEWNGGEESGARIKYTCGVCGKETEQASGKTLVSTLTAVGGYWYAGTTLPDVTAFTPEFDNDVAEIVKVEWTSGDVTYSPGIDVFPADVMHLHMEIAAKGEHYFNSSSLVFFNEICGKFYSGATCTYDSDTHILNVDFDYTAMAAPTFEYIFPAAIEEGMNLYDLTNECVFKSNDVKTDLIVFVTVEGFDVPIVNIYSKDTDTWTLDSSNYLADYDEETAKEMEKIATVATNKSYLFSIFPSMIDCRETLPSNVRFNNTENAANVELNGSTAYAQFVVESSAKHDIALVTTAPVSGETPDTSHGESWNCTGKFRCGNAYTVTFLVKPAKGEHFDAGTSASVNKMTAKTELLSDGRLKVTYTFAKLDHKFSSFSTVASPTCDQDGRAERVCSVCSAAETMTIERLKHEYVAGYCMHCGAADPDYDFGDTKPVVLVTDPNFAVTVSAAQNGSVKASAKQASAGELVTLTVTPDTGWVLYTITVFDAKGREIALTAKNAGTYTFTMPASNATVKAAFSKESTAPACFVDIETGDYFYDAVMWAAGEGITSGTDTTHFSPDMPCTRAQMVTFLWRAAGSPEPKDTICPFNDVDCSEYYYEAVMWAIGRGIIEGIDASTFGTDKICTRSQAVTFLYRYAGTPDVSAKCFFTDIKRGEYYYNAVMWAIQNGVTEGTSKLTFSPDAECTRAQVVTLLYRDLVK